MRSALANLPSFLIDMSARLRGPSVRKTRQLARVLGIETTTRRFLLTVTVPLWLGAGLADWYCHRHTRIEATAGTRESAIHALMMTEAGVPTVVGLFYEVNAGVLVTSLGALGAHEATAIWDVSYAEGRRRITPAEQHVHSLLEIVPLMATGFLLVLHWDQARALLGRGAEPADFTLRPKQWPLPRRSRLGVLGAIVVAGLVPYAEELWRCWRTGRSLRAQPGAAGCGHADAGQDAGHFV